MSKHDDTISLKQMLDHAIEVGELLRGKSKSDLSNERLLQLAVTRLVEIIGEAAGRVSEETCEINQQISWASIVGLRNRLIHGYDTVDYNILWVIVSKDLPQLIKQLEKIISKG